MRWYKVNEMKDFHPIVAVIYYASIIGLSMFSDSPFFLAISLICGICYSLYLIISEEGIQNAVKSLKAMVAVFSVVFVFSVLMNGLFSHNGKTVLFYIGPNRITLEAFVYGAIIALMITTVITWFVSFGKVMTSDKLINVFGHLAPVLGLTISMIFRFIPLLRRRYKDIKMGQVSLGRNNIKGPINKIKQMVKEISILISWSLEASIESADSMAARGYGLHGRSSYRIFKFEKRDYIASALILILTALVVWSFVLGAYKVYYFPEIRFANRTGDMVSALALLLFSVLALFPMILEMYEDYKWKKSE